MSEPPDLPHRLQLARELFAPTAAQRERVRTGLAARPDFRAPGQATRASGRGLAAAKASRMLALVKGGALVGVGFALGYWFSELRASERTPSAGEGLALVAPAGGDGRGPRVGASSVASGGAGGANERSPESPTIARAVGEASDSAAPEAAPAPDGMERSGAVRSSAATPTSHTPPRHRARPADAASASREELALLQRAERAIRAGDGALGRSFIDELDARFPKTIWREERDAVLVLAGCTLREPEASERARAFLQRRASSMYHDRITSLCRLDDAASLELHGPDGSPSAGHSSVRRKIP